VSVLSEPRVRRKVCLYVNHAMAIYGDCLHRRVTSLGYLQVGVALRIQNDAPNIVCCNVLS
jgi:hypothetical protein